MLTDAAGQRPDLARRVRLLSWLTVAWLGVDGAIGMAAGLATDSVVLVGWALDCAIEAAAAVVLVWRFTGERTDSATAELLARRFVGATFILLVPYIVVQAVHHLIGGNESGVSRLGIALAASDAVLMPLLGTAKTRAGIALDSAATTGSGKQNVVCAYLSVAVLLGLGANALFEAWWADPIAALVVGAVCLQAGLATWSGDSC